MRVSREQITACLDKNRLVFRKASYTNVDGEPISLDDIDESSLAYLLSQAQIVANEVARGNDSFSFMGSVLVNGTFDEVTIYKGSNDS